MRSAGAKTILLLLGGLLALGLVALAWLAGSGSSQAEEGSMTNCPQANKWAIAVWDGDDGTDVEQALASCGEGAVAVAYSIDPETQNWLRYFADRPEISNLTALDNLQGILALGAAGASPPVSAAISAQQDAMQNCPLQDRWAISVWSGQDGTSAEQALATCGEDVVALAYYVDPQTQVWSRWFRDRPEISNLSTLKDLQGLIMLGSAEAPATRTPTPTPTPVSLVAFVSDRPGDEEIYVMYADGTEQTNLTNASGDDWWPAWSPDGTKIAFNSDRDDNMEIYVMNIDGTDQTNLTDDTAWDGGPAWSPDGSKIAFYSFRAADANIYVMNADGTDRTRITDDPANESWPDWSPDGTKIVYGSDRDGDWEIYVMNADGTDRTRLTENSDWDGWPRWSPDGTKIAFTSHRDDNDEIYVMNADGTDQTNLTTNSAADYWPTWSPDGDKIAFTSDRTGDSEIYEMDADGETQVNVTHKGSAKDFWPAWSPWLPPDAVPLPPASAAMWFAMVRGYE
jgi:hypothetical protein